MEPFSNAMSRLLKGKGRCVPPMIGFCAVAACSCQCTSRRKEWPPLPAPQRHHVTASSVLGSLHMCASSTALTWHLPARRQDEEEEEGDEQTAWERVTSAAGAAMRKLSDWGVVSPRLMLAGGGLFLTLSNWGLLPSVRTHMLRHAACHLAACSSEQAPWPLATSY